MAEKDVKVSIDKLTRLPDMAGFQFSTARVLKIGIREETVVVYFDIEDFKSYNVKYGKHSGDILLRHFANVLKEVFENDTIARVSDDDFVVYTYQDGVEDKIDSVYLQLSRWDPETNLEIKAGIASVEDANHIVTDCDHAKVACEYIKHAPGVHYKYYDDSLEEEFLGRKYILDHFQTALQAGRITAYYLPIIRVMNGKVTGLEAVSKWKDEKYGEIPPHVFLPVLESASLVHLLDLEIAKETVQCILKLEESGHVALPIAFNLSRRDFDLCDIVEEIDKIVTQANVTRSLVNIEITENSLSEDDGVLFQALSRFKKLGYKVWLNDFGSLNSSLNFIKDYDFDVLKISNLFLEKDTFSRDGKNSVIMSSIVDMAKKLGMETLCAGVDTDAKFEFLKSIGCENAQGTIFHEAVDMNAIMHMNIDFEPTEERRYMNAIGKVNLYSQKPFNKGNFDGTPMMILEGNGETFKVLLRNDSFDHFLNTMGFDDSAQFDDIYEGTNSKLIKQVIRASEEAFISMKPQKVYQVLNGYNCVLTVHPIAKKANSSNYAILMEAKNITSKDASDKMDDLNAVIRNLYNLCTRLDLIDFKENKIHTLYQISSRYHGDLEGMEIAEGFQTYAVLNIHPNDRKTFTNLYDPERMIQRINERGQQYSFAILRTKDDHNQYTWQMYITIIVVMNARQQVISLVCDADPLAVHIAKMLEDEKVGLTNGLNYNENLSETITGVKLLESILNVAQIGFFWKDKNRRFLGANRYFREYYGFTSQDEYVGKTDEEMGWHVDNKPFMDDEYRVLEYGEETKNVPGTCIAKGCLRNILASKAPIYEGGEIIGLVGYFIDVTGTFSLEGSSKLTMDLLTGLLDENSLKDVYQEYEHVYQQKRNDFALMRIDVENFESVCAEKGNDYADQILVRVAEGMKKTLGSSTTVARIGKDRFAVLAQFTNAEEVQRLRTKLDHEIDKIKEEYSDEIMISIDTIIYSEVARSQKTKLLATLLA